MLLIFIGYVFIFFQLPVNGFDLLAVFIGYVLVYMGLSKFTEEKSFVAAKPFTQLMAVLNLIYSVGGQWLPDIAVAALGVVTMILSLYILFMFNQGIQEMEWRTNAYLKADKLKATWRYQMIFTVGNGILTLLLSDVFAIIANMFGIVAMIANIMFLYHLIGVKEALEQLGQEN